MKRKISLALVLVLLMSLVCALPANAASYKLTASQIKSCEQAWDAHGWVLKKNFWPNYSTTGRNAIKATQKLLCSIGYTTDIDGCMGNDMIAKVKAFQKQAGITVDGYVGSQTFDTLLGYARRAGSSSTTTVSSSRTGYKAANALSFAKANVYKNTHWLCAEYVSRALRAGGLDIGVHPGVGNLFRALEKINGVTKYKLNVQSNGTILLKNNAGKIAKGDPIVIYCNSCLRIDGKPYIHAVLVSDTSSSSGIKVYAHNRAYNNAIYRGFNYCKFCGTYNTTVYGFHIN